MKKRALAILLSVVTAGAVVGTANDLYSYADGVKLQIAGKQNEQQMDDAQKRAAFSNVSTAELVDNTDMFRYAGVADIAEAAMPAIVAITNKSVQEVRSYFRGHTFQYESESSGSGIIMGENETELLICTNNHVVEDSTELTVSFIDESSYEAKVKGTDPSNDLAVIAVNLEEIEKETLDQIKIAQMGDSEKMRVGEQVVAIGNALGYGQSVTTGIVSAKNRSIGVNDGNGGSTFENLIQTDAAINPGNSGGALLNMNGELVGINSAKASASGVEGMGYAIPVDKALPILEKLMTKQTRSIVEEEDAAYMGINGEGVTEEVIQLYNVPAGVYVTAVGEDTPAEEAGLQRGDIITAFDDTAVRSMEELTARLQYYKGGETVEMTIQTAPEGAYVEKTLEITLGLRREYMQ